MVVTGGSEGIGRALAERFAMNGHDLLLIARRRDVLEATAVAIREKHRVQVFIAAIDLASEGAVGRVLDALRRLGVYADVLVNCAGLGVPGLFIENDPARARETLALNVTSATELTRALLPDMVDRGRGGVLSVSSIAGLVPAPYVALYAATKAYMIALTRALAMETRNTGVAISVAVPGPVATKFMNRELNAENWIMDCVPTLPSDIVARVAYEGFVSRQTVITPGFLSALYRIGIKVIPHAWLIRMIRPLLFASFADESRANRS